MGQQFYCIYTQKNLKQDVKRYLYIYIHRSTIHSSQKVEATQISINERMDKQNMTYPYNGTLWSFK